MQRAGFVAALLFLTNVVSVTWAQVPQAPPYPAADDRYKADILVVVAHPDDDMAAAPYTARALDEGKRVAVIFCTRGNSGPNFLGREQAASLGAVREIEGRRSEAALGVIREGHECYPEYRSCVDRVTQRSYARFPA